MRESTIDVSIIIPTFNRIEYLYPTLLCLINQKFLDKEYEVVIVDSGTDNTRDYISYLSKSKNCSIIYKKVKRSRNRSSLRNIGARISKGTTLIFLDNDMLVPENFVETHYNRHIVSDDKIILGKRRSLIEFTNNSSTHDLLINNFDLIEKLPFYEDVRDDVFNSNKNYLSKLSNPWAYTFSHNFSISRNSFFKVKGFNKKFGNNWGYEDIEFGYRCFKMGYNFELETSIYAYHQPHMEQSKLEQSNAIENKSLFISIHNCFEVEIYISFYNDFETLFNKLLDIRNSSFINNEFEIKSNKKLYNLILGCLYTHKDKSTNNRYKLGLFLPGYKNRSLNNILILRTFYEFPVELQLSLLHEAYRVGNNIHFQKYNTKDLECIKKVSNIVGYNIAVKDIGDYYIVNTVERAPIKAMQMVIPSVTSPSKRFAYLFLAKKLIENGYELSICDTKGTNNFSNEDFEIDSKAQELLKENIKRSFGSCIPRTVISTDLHINSSANFINDPRNIVLHDHDFNHILGFNLFRPLSRCSHYDTSWFNSLLFSGMDEYLQYNKLEKEEKIISNKEFLTIMETGLKEDGIDIVLKSFKEYIKEDHTAKLIIKIPDYSILMSKNHPCHNSASVELKSFPEKLAISNDEYELKELINSLSLNKNVTIIKRNLSIREHIDLLIKSSVFLCLGRKLVPHPLVYAAVKLNMSVIISEHYLINNEIKACCNIVKSEDIYLTEDFNVAISSSNIGFISKSIDEKALVSTIKGSHKINYKYNSKICLNYNI